jgi:hypothetical protein
MNSRTGILQAMPPGLSQTHWPGLGAPPPSTLPPRTQVNGGDQYWQYQPPRQPLGGVYYPQPPRRRSTAWLWWLLAATSMMGVIFWAVVVLVALTSGPSEPAVDQASYSQGYRAGTSGYAAASVSQGGNAKYACEVAYSWDDYGSSVKNDYISYLQGCESALDGK